MKRTITLLLLLTLLLALAGPALAADGYVDAKITGTFCYSYARQQLAMVNDFRTGSEAWYWNSDNTSKTA